MLVSPANQVTTSASAMWCAKHCPGDPLFKGGGDSRTGRQQLCTRDLQQRIQGHRSTSIVGVTAPPPGMNFTAIAPNKKGRRRRPRFWLPAGGGDQLG